MTSPDRHPEDVRPSHAAPGVSPDPTPGPPSPAQRRENADPHEAANPVPRGLLALVAGLLVFAVGYIAHARLDTPADWGDGRTRLELEGTAGPAAVDGAAVFASRCAACHQATGQGVPGVFPPLAGSEWVRGRDTTTAAIVLNGIDGPLTVRGMVFRGAMPAFRTQLDDAQVAAVLTHVRRQWGNSAPVVTAATVAQVRAQTQGLTRPFAGEAELPPHD